MLPAERAAELAQGPVTIDIDATDVEVYGTRNAGGLHLSGAAGRRTWRPGRDRDPAGRRPAGRRPDPRSSVVALLGRALAALPQAVRDGRRPAEIALRADAGTSPGTSPAPPPGGHGVRDRRQRITSSGRRWPRSPRSLAARPAWKTRRSPSHPTGPPNGRRTVLLIRRSAWTQSRSPPTPVPAPPHPAPRSAALPIPELGLNPPSTPTASSSPTSTVHPGPAAPASLVPAPHRRREHLPRQQARRRAAAPASGYEQVNTAWSGHR